MGEVMVGGTLDRRAVVAELLAGRTELAVVTGLGSPSYDVMAAGDHALNYYLWAAMGGAAMVGLGLAMAAPTRPVLVVTGDGEAMMGMGALATIGVKRPRNLTIAVLDNGHFGETGMQRSHAGLGTDIAGIARACGFARADTLREMNEVVSLRERLAAGEGPQLAVIKISGEELPRALPSRDGVHIKNRFRAALGHAPI